MTSKDWGVVEKLTVIADTRTSLVAALTIALTEHSSVSHYELKEKDGIVSLKLLWSKGESATAIPFLAVITDPNALASEIERWLTTAKYPEEPDTDGSTKKGYKIVNAGNDGWSYAVVTVTPHWVIYGK